VKVPFLQTGEIERKADVLLGRFWQAHDVPLSLPIPIEDILERHLQLSLGFDDLHERFNVPQTGEAPDVLGALFVQEQEVLINEVLDPDVDPSREGRFRFTVSHEIGHWQLHREVVSASTEELELFDAGAEPSIICRRSQAREPIEWQADAFAACLLMPRRLVADAWRGHFGDQRSRIVPDDEEVRYHMRPLAAEFLVSFAAMRIRCEQLGLLHRESPAQRLLTTAS